MLLREEEASHTPSTVSRQDPGASDDLVAAFAHGTVVWAVVIAVALYALALLFDAALVLARGARGSVALASSAAGAALATFVALAFAPGAAALELFCRRVARSKRAWAWPFPIAAAAFVVGGIATGAIFQPANAGELGVVAGFAVAIVACAILSRAKHGPVAALGLAAVAAYAELRAPIVRRDWLDLIAIVGMCALVAAGRGARRRLVLVAKTRVFLAMALLIVASVATLRIVDRAPPQWRVASERHARYGPRFARACRSVIDLDGDGFSAIAWGGDCDDSDPQRNPRAHELPNGIDRNCNGTVRPATPTDSERGLAPPTGDPNLARGDIDLFLLVTIDAWRADSLRADVMPQTVALASRSLTMGRLYAAGTATRITLRLSLRVGADEDSVASRLEHAGVDTHVVFAFNRRPLREGLLDGFSDVRMPEGERWNARETTDAAIQAVHAPGNGPRFVWVHYFDAHQPLIEVTPGVVPAYLSELRFIDRQIGRLLSALPTARTMIIVTADHGEGFDANGVAFHAVTSKEVLMHVPAIVVAPGLHPMVHAGLTSSRDLAPTILGAFGRADPSTERFGRSWLRLRDAPNAELHEFVVSYSSEAKRGATYVMPLAAIVEPRLKLVETFENTLVEAYDPVSDPLEVVDRSAFDPSETARLRRRLALFRDIDGYL